MLNRWVSDFTRLAFVVTMAVLAACSFQAELSFYLGCDGRSCKINASARVLTGDAVQRAKPSENQVVLPSTDARALNLKPDTILVSPDFVRRVKGVSTAGDETVVDTSEASLDEAIEKGQTSIVYRLAVDEAVAASAAALSPKGGGFAKDGAFNLEIHQSVDLDTTTRVWLDGSVRFDPSFDVDLSFRPTTAHAYVVGSLDANLRVSGRVGVVGKGYLVEKSVVLWDPPAVKIPLPSIGVVPISLSAKLTLRAYLRVETDGSVTVETGYTVKSTGRYGFDYYDDTLHEVASWPTETTFTPPKLTVVPPRLAITGGLRVELEGAINGGWKYLGGSAGMTLGANAYGRLDVSTSGWSGVIGVSADSTAFLKVVALWWSDEWRTTPKELLRWEKPFLGGSPPSVAGCAQWTKACGPSFGCAKCELGASCFLSSDCSSGKCSANGVCVDLEGTKGSGESCWDGSTFNLAACKPGLRCIAEGSFWTYDYICRDWSCGNRATDAGETDLDCGGATAEGMTPSCKRCRVGFGCRFNADCESNVCRDGLCRRL